MSNIAYLNALQEIREFTSKQESGDILTQEQEDRLNYLYEFVLEYNKITRGSK